MTYSRHMVRALLRLLFAFSLMTMPFGMANAAAVVPVHGDVAAMADHPAAVAAPCSDHRKPASAPIGSDLHCAACAALPAIDAPAPAAESMPKAPLHKTVATLSLAQDPEVMTPPPKAI